MHYDELWQIFADNGTSITNKGAEPKIFNSDKKLGMGNSHIWFWKKDGDNVEIMLQKRALNKPNRPGWYHISAGGHINVGETPVIAAIRETEEEMGITIDPEKLFFVQSVRIIEKDPRDIVHVYLYKLNGDEKFTYLDGEVDSYEWRSINDFEEMAKNAEDNKLVPQGELYFKTLTTALEYISKKSSEI